MTTGLDTRPTNVVEDAAPRKSRSGTETRRRSKHMTLRLLPQEEVVAQVVADEFDMPSIQALIIDACQPLMSPVPLQWTASRCKAGATARNLRGSSATFAGADFAGGPELRTGGLDPSPPPLRVLP
jgi:hypothetical protein